MEGGGWLIALILLAVLDVAVDVAALAALFRLARAAYRRRRLAMVPPDDWHLMAGKPDDAELEERWKRVNRLLQYDDDLVSMALTRRRRAWLRRSVGDVRLQIGAALALGLALERFAGLEIVQFFLGGK